MSKRNRRSKKQLARRKMRRRIFCFVLFCVLLGAGYFGGRYYFTTHFYPVTLINGVDCGMYDSQESYDHIFNYLSAYQLTVHSEDGDLPIKAEDVGLTYDNKGELDQLLAQQDINRWFLYLNTPFEYQAMTINLDEGKLTETVAGLACMNPKEPRESTNASIVYDENAETYVIQEGQLGNRVNVEAFQNDVRDAILQGRDSIDLLSGAYYVRAEYLPDNEKVVKAQEKANKYLKSTIHYKKGDKKLTLKPKKISSFITIDGDYKVKLNKDKIKEYVKDKVSSKFNTSKSLTIIKSPGSGNIYVANGDNTKAVNVDKETNKLFNLIKKGKSVTREPIYVEDYLYSSNAGIVDKDFVDINLSKQKVFVVKKGKTVVSSDCVTGNLSTGRCTPQGIYKIAYKTREHQMVKYNAFVHYWMPYDTRYGIGLHDATWRSKFGGDIFRTDGSHACVNLPLSKAAKIYEEVYAGIPVIVHW